MVRMILQLEGMVCGMCEAHVNEAVRKAFSVKKVTSSHAKGRTEILVDELLDEEALKKAIDETGYRVVAVQTEPCEKKGFFRR